MARPDADEEELFAELVEAIPDLTEEICRGIEERSPAYRVWQEEGKGVRLRWSIALIVKHFADTCGSDRLPEELRDIGAYRADQGLPLDAIPTAWLVISDHVWRWMVTHAGRHDRVDMTDLWSRFQSYVTRSAGTIQDSYIQARSEAYADEVTLMRAALDRLVAAGVPEETSQELARLGHRGDQLRMLMCRHANPDVDLLMDADAGFQRLLFHLKPHLRRRPLWSLWQGHPYLLLPPDIADTDIRQAVGNADRDLRAVLSRTVATTSLLGELSSMLEPLLRLADDDQPLINAGRLDLPQIVAAHVGPGLQLRMMPDWLRLFFAGDAEHQHKWSETACTLLETGTNVGQASVRLHVHHNTIYYRLEAIQRHCKTDIKDPARLADIRLAMQLWPDPWEVADWE